MVCFTERLAIGGLIMSNHTDEKGSILSFLPLFVFVFLFVGSGILTRDFTNMPLNVAVLIAAAVALIMNRKEKFGKKVEVFIKYAGDSNILLMAVIFILAGAFSSVSKGMGAVESTVNLGLTMLPPNLLMIGLFLIGCFISVAMGTSVGTIVALAPIGVGIATETGMPIALAMATIVGGAMFGDNLSMISDTTIAAVRTQQTAMRDKFKVNFWIVLPGALMTILLLGMLTKGETAALTGAYPFELIKVLPYIGVFTAALFGVHVLIVLVGGIIVSGVIGLIDGSYTLLTLFEFISEGMMSMEDLTLIAILIGGIVGMIHHNGGIDYLLRVVKRRVKTKKGAEFGIAGLVSAADIATANNTIAIIMTGPLAKEIADEYEIDPRKSASLLDTFSSCFQGLIPYGAQLLAAAGLASISPISMLTYSFYPILMGICASIAIVIGFPKMNKQ